MNPNASQQKTRSNCLCLFLAKGVTPVMPPIHQIQQISVKRALFSLQEALIVFVLVYFVSNDKNKCQVKIRLKQNEDICHSRKTGTEFPLSRPQKSKRYALQYLSLISQ